MFIKSTSKKEYLYKVLRVFRNSDNEKPYTTVVLFTKNINNQIINAEVTVWEFLDVKQNDYVAIYNIMSVDFIEKDKTYKVFKTITIKSSQVKVVKECDYEKWKEKNS